MSDISDFFPLFDADEATVYAEMAARANDGIGPDDPDWTDTRVGSIFYLINMPAAIAVAAAYTRMNEAAAAGIVATSWETYLDLHAESYGTERKAAAYAVGRVRFDGLAGTLVASGVRVLSVQTDPEIDPPIFETTQSGTIPSPLAVPAGFTVAPNNTGGVLAAGTYYYRVTAVDDEGYESPSAELGATIVGGAGGRIQLDGADVPGAVGYRLYRGLAPGGPYSEILPFTPPASVLHEGQAKQLYGVASDNTDFGLVTINAAVHPPTANETGGHRTLNVQALESGEAGNVAAGTLTQMDTGISGVTAVVNDLPVDGGSEVESDPALKARLAQRFDGGKGANKAWYASLALEEPGVGWVTVVPNWDGPGTVHVIVLDSDRRAVPQIVVDALQVRLDPNPGQGDGEAPIDHEVTVDTAAEITVGALMHPIFKPGYSLDGEDGTVAQRDELIGAWRDYVASLEAGDDVVYNAAKAAFFDAPGLLDLSGVQTIKVGGSYGTADIAIAIDPPEVAVTNSDGSALAFS